MATKKSGMKTATKVEIGASLAVLAATAAGVFFLYGKNGAKNRKKVKGWMLKAKGEVLDQMEKMKDVSEASYHEVVDRVKQKYQTIKSIDPAELDQMVKELKGHWTSIKKQISSVPAKKSKVAKK